MIETAKAILKRGDPVLIFPEGTRTRPGALGKPKRGVGRLALETGATVVPGRDQAAPRRSARASASARTRSACGSARR